MRKDRGQRMKKNIRGKVRRRKDIQWKINSRKSEIPRLTSRGIVKISTPTLNMPFRIIFLNNGAI